MVNRKVCGITITLIEYSLPPFIPFPPPSSSPQLSPTLHLFPTLPYPPPTHLHDIVVHLAHVFALIVGPGEVDGATAGIP